MIVYPNACDHVIKVQPCSAPVAYYFSGPKPKFDLVGGFFVASLPESARAQMTSDSNIFVMDVPEISCLKKNYVGSYDGLPAVWDEVWKLMPGPEDPYWSSHKACWEEYVVNCDGGNPSTDIYVQAA
jgi:hypothetical protein